MIQKILKQLKNMKWWGWVLIGLVVLWGFNQMSGYAYSKKLWTMVKEQITTEEKKIIADKIREIETLEREKQTYRARIMNLQKREVQLNAKITDLQKKNDALEIRLASITVPAATDIDGLAKRFKERGYRPTIMLPR